MVCLSFLHYTSLCISCDNNLGEFLMLYFVLWALCCSFLSLKIYVCTWVDLLFVNRSTQHTNFHVRRAPGMVGSDKKKFFHLHNLLELTGQKKFSNCPKFLKHENIFRMPQKFGHKWKLSSTFIRCRLLLSKMRIPKMPINFKHPNFSKCPIYFG